VRVVDEVPLRVESRVLRDNLHAIFIRTDRSVRAQTVEDAPGDRVLLDGKARIDFETSVRDIVVDADRETILGLGLRKLVKDGFDHSRREVFG
jgi:hypothetical protein